MKKMLIWLLEALCVAAFAWNAYQMGSTLLEYHKEETISQGIAEHFTKPAEAPAQRPESPQEEAASPLSPPITVDFESLMAANPDVRGWLYAEDTPISYPVVQGESNDTYIHRMADGTSNRAGSIFMDFRCAGDFSEQFTVLYGHHMKNGSMFGSIHDYTEAGYYESHPYLWLLTPKRDYLLEVLSGCVVDGNDEVYDLNFWDESLETLLERLDSESTFDRYPSVARDSTKHILLLSTCSYEADEARYVVACQMSPIENE